MSNPAEQLLNQVLDNGWMVVEQVERPDSATGGCFSCGYRVRSEDGAEGYLKALDYSGAFRDPDPARILQAMTEAFNFERTLCEKCRDRRLKRVVTAISDG